MQTQILIALGSNKWARQKVVKARRLLDDVVTVTSESRLLRNAAIGHDAPDFINQLIVCHTTLDEESLMRKLKDVERDCGNTPENRQKKTIFMDIDLLAYDDIQYHVSDWQRGYIRLLFSEIDDKTIRPVWRDWASIQTI